MAVAGCRPARWLPAGVAAPARRLLGVLGPAPSVAAPSEAIDLKLPLRLYDCYGRMASYNLQEFASDAVPVFCYVVLLFVSRL